jgi:hypothetical protein
MYWRWRDGGNAESVAPLTRQVLNVAKAFNDRSSIVINEKQYDFSNATGKIEYLIAGHTHMDEVIIDSNIPCITTVDAMRNNILSFDLIFTDYTNRKIHLVRIGNGNSRVVDLPTK